MQYVSKEDITSFSADGIHSFTLEKDVPSELPEEHFANLVVLGARPVDPNAKAPVIVPDEERLGKVVEAVRQILDTNLPEHLTSEGYARADAVNGVLGFASTKEEREAAHKIIEG